MGSEASKPHERSSGNPESEWKGKLYLRTDEDNLYCGNPEELRRRLEEIVENKECIKKVYIFWHKLYSWQLTGRRLFHPLVILETSKWWWSFEKNAEGITIQRSSTLEIVRDYYRSDPRYTFSFLVHDSSRKTLGDLISWLWQRKDLFVLGSIREHGKCQEFSDGIFDFCSTSEND